MRNLTFGLVGLLLGGCVSSSSVPGNAPVRVGNLDEILPINDTRIMCIPVTTARNPTTGKHELISALCVDYTNENGDRVETCELGSDSLPFDGIPDNIALLRRNGYYFESILNPTEVRDYEDYSAALLKQAAGAYLKTLEMYLQTDSSKIEVTGKEGNYSVSFSHDALKYSFGLEDSKFAHFIIKRPEVHPRFQDIVEIYGSFGCEASPVLASLDTLAERVKETLKLD